VSARAVTLIAVPYHLGREGAGMALGPDAYLEGGLPDALAALGCEVRLARVEREGPFVDTPAAVADINARLADIVAAALDDDRLPLIAGGNCNVALGAVAGLQQADAATGGGVQRGGRAPAGVVWCDAHGDFNTPETTPGGFFDGMPLAILTGHCHRRVWSRLRRGRDELVGPIADELVVHVGGRDFDPGERRAFEQSAVALVSSQELIERGPEALDAPLAQLATRARAVYLHIDIDVLDPTTAGAVDFPAPDGLSFDDLAAVVDRVVTATSLRVVSVTAYDPEHDDAAHRTRTLGTRLIARVVERGLTCPT